MGGDLPLGEPHAGQQWPGPGACPILSHWLGAAWEEGGLGLNAVADPEGSLLERNSFLKEDLSSPSPWLPRDD